MDLAYSQVVSAVWDVLYYLTVTIINGVKIYRFCDFLYFQGTNFSYLGSIYYDFNNIHCY